MGPQAQRWNALTGIFHAIIPETSKPTAAGDRTDTRPHVQVRNAALGILHIITARTSNPAGAEDRTGMWQPIVEGRDTHGLSGSTVPRKATPSIGATPTGPHLRISERKDVHHISQTASRTTKTPLAVTSHVAHTAPSHRPRAALVSATSGFSLPIRSARVQETRMTRSRPLALSSPVSRHR
jgi:hypothetical protein